MKFKYIIPVFTRERNYFYICIELKIALSFSLREIIFYLVITEKC